MLDVWQFGYIHAFQVATLINELSLRQNSRNFTDDIFWFVYLNTKYDNLILISLNFVPTCPVDIVHTLDQIIACHRSGVKDWE